MERAIGVSISMFDEAVLTSDSVQEVTMDVRSASLKLGTDFSKLLDQENSLSSLGLVEAALSKASSITVKPVPEQRRYMSIRRHFPVEFCLGRSERTTMEEASSLMPRNMPIKELRSWQITPNLLILKEDQQQWCIAKLGKEGQ